MQLPPPAHGVLPGLHLLPSAIAFTHLLPLQENPPAQPFPVQQGSFEPPQHPLFSHPSAQLLLDTAVPLPLHVCSEPPLHVLVPATQTLHWVPVQPMPLQSFEVSV